MLVLYQPKLNDENYLQVGDAVLLVQGQYWCKVILDSHSGNQDEFQGSLYWNYSDPDGNNPTGGYLFPGHSWGVLRGPWKDVTDFNSVQIVLPQTCDQFQDTIKKITIRL